MNILIVPVVKSNRNIRLRSDYKITINPQLIINGHPFPRVTDLLSKLNQGKVFSKLDLAHAYQQVEITTHKKLFRYNRLSFGIASAPGLFQGLIEKIVSKESYCIF